MAQATVTRTNFLATLEQKFEEIPLIWKTDEDGTNWYDGMVTGVVEISYDDEGNWNISDIWLAVDNGKQGYDAKGQLINLHADEDRTLFLMVLDSIMARMENRIDAWVADELAYADAA